MTHRDMGKATFGQSGNRDIPGSKCSIKVCTFMHLRVQGVKCNAQKIPLNFYNNFIIYSEYKLSQTWVFPGKLINVKCEMNM